MDNESFRPDHTEREADVSAHPDETGQRPPRVVLVRRSFPGGDRGLLFAAVALAVVVALSIYAWRKDRASTVVERDGQKAAGASPDADADDEAGEVALDPSAIQTIGLQIETVASRAAVAPLVAAGSIESNAEREQQVVSLVSGRVGSARAGLGDRVTRGTVLATIESPQIAELQGQLSEARSSLALATSNVERVRTAANRAGVIAARAKLDLATKTLARKRRLVAAGGLPEKDVQEAEAEYATAKAEYDYQASIASSREVQEAESAREAARATVDRLRQSLDALGATPDGHTAVIPVTAPISGVVVKREVNAGAGVQEGTPMFTVADTSTVWVVANVPERKVSALRVGVPADVRSEALGSEHISGTVSYIDSALDEETRTARVRVAIANPGGRLKTGTFVEVTFHVYLAGGEDDEGDEGKQLMVPEGAVQRIGDRTVVFVPGDEPGHFATKDVEVGESAAGYVQIRDGLDEGDRVVTKGSFELKSKLVKGSFGEDDDE